MSHDGLATHARDELGISETVGAHPIQVALTSAVTFSVGAFLPLTAVSVVPIWSAILVVSITALASLGLLGAVSARAGGAGVVKAAAPVMLWGVLALSATAGIGKLFGTLV